MVHTFIINTENVNGYGYRILSRGIDIEQYMRNPVVLFMHDRYIYSQRGSEVIGRATKVYLDKKDGEDVLMADIEFDTNNEFAKTIADKVEKGFIRMASLSADVKATSSEPGLVLNGQKYETVTDCKLIEISIVDIGGNDDALKLSQNGQPLTLNKIKTENMSKLITLALTLGLTAEANEEAITAEALKLKKEKEDADNKVIALSNELKGIKTAEATELVDKAIALKLLPESLKATQISAFDNDFEGQKAILSKLISEVPQTNQGVIREVILGGGGKGTKSTEETFDFLQKNNPAKLGLIRDTNPELYKQLAADYAKGVRAPKE